MVRYEGTYKCPFGSKLKIDGELTCLAQLLSLFLGKRIGIGNPNARPSRTELEILVEMIVDPTSF